VSEAFKSTPPLAEIHSASRAGATWDAEDLSLAGTGSRPGAAANDRQLSGPPIAYPKSEWHAAKQAASAAPSRLQERSCMRSGFEHSG